MKSLLIILFIFLSQVTIAGVDERKFATVEQEQQYQLLIEELRCLVCQNQNLADSNAELAQDLREQVYLMINKGDSNEAIVDFMVSRYGDFVLYRPPFKSNTLLLWAGPFVIMLIGLIVVFRFIRRRKISSSPGLSQGQKEEVKKLLDDEKDD